MELVFFDLSRVAVVFLSLYSIRPGDRVEILVESRALSAASQPTPGPRLRALSCQQMVSQRIFHPHSPRGTATGQPMHQLSVMHRLRDSRHIKLANRVQPQRLPVVVSLVRIYFRQSDKLTARTARSRSSTRPPALYTHRRSDRCPKSPAPCSKPFPCDPSSATARKSR